MAETRTCDIHLNADDKRRVAEETGYPALNEALGYLATWNMSFNHVDITLRHSHRRLELHADYRREPDDGGTYHIMAVWEPDPEDITGGKFSFHS